jgi:hypothetical protein
MTIGDVNAMIAGVGASGVTLWASLLGISALFGERTRRAANAIEAQPGRTLGHGFLLAATAGIVGVALVNQPNGLIKFVGWVLLAGLLATAALGSAGLSRVTGERVGRMDPKLSTLGAVGRGAGLLVTAGFLPVLGWFGFFPVMLFVSLGAGCRAMTEKATPRDEPRSLSAEASAIGG